MAISTNLKPTIYRNLYDNTDPGVCSDGKQIIKAHVLPRNARQVATGLIVDLLPVGSRTDRPTCRSFQVTQLTQDNQTMIV